MSADSQHTTLRWILRCFLAFLLSTRIASAISPVRWDYPSTLGLARFHGRAAGMDVAILRAALRPVGSPRIDRQKKGKKDDAALIAAVREVLTGVSAPPVVAGTVPAAAVQATAFSLLPAPPPVPPVPPADVVAAISTISSQVTEQQRKVFGLLSDKEFRDHFSKTFNL